MQRVRCLFSRISTLSISRFKSIGAALRYVCQQPQQLSYEGTTVVCTLSEKVCKYVVDHRTNTYMSLAIENAIDRFSCTFTYLVPSATGIAHPLTSTLPLLCYSKEAKKRLREAIDALMAGDASAEMEQALEKWDKYVTNHPDHIKEQAAEEQAWEDENEPKNNEALHLMKTFVPPNIFHAGLEGLREGGLPPALAKRIFDRKVG